MMALFLKVRCVGLGVLLATLVIWIPTVNPVSYREYRCTIPWRQTFGLVQRTTPPPTDEDTINFLNKAHLRRPKKAEGKFTRFYLGLNIKIKTTFKT